MTQVAKWTSRTTHDWNCERSCTDKVRDGYVEQGAPVWRSLLASTPRYRPRMIFPQPHTLSSKNVCGSTAPLRVNLCLCNTQKALRDMKLDLIMAVILQLVCHASGQEAQGIPDSPPPASDGGSPPMNATALLEAKTLPFLEEYSSSRVTRRMSVISVAPGEDALQVAHDAASPGDELVLDNGVFTSSSGASVLNITKSITIRALNPGQAVVDGENARRGIHITSGVVELHGLNVTKGSATATNGYVVGYAHFRT